MSTQEIRDDEELSLEVSSEPAFVCDCDKWVRSACSGLPFYREKQGKRYCVLHYPGKDKSEEFRIAMQQKLDSADFNFQGVWFPDDLDFIGFEFSQQADFSRATFTETADFSVANFSAEANFSDATFTKSAYFGDATFTKTAKFSEATFIKEAYFNVVTFIKEADFSGATFTERIGFIEATFKDLANFIGVTFIEIAYFNEATFTKSAYFSDTAFTKAANFSRAIFNKEVEFIHTTFTKSAFFTEANFTDLANFSGVTFTEEANFIEVIFAKSVNFTDTIFKDYLSFAGNNERNVFSDGSSLDLQFAKIEKPDRVSFHTLKLRPHWFINVDAREFEFTNVEWMPDGFEIKKELEAMERKRIQSPHRMLSIACRQLALNAEESHRYEEASKFRYMSMDARRREPGRRPAFLSLHWWYWLASGYGERIGRAFLMLGAVWLLFALLYTQVGFTRSLPKIEGAETVDLIGEPLRLGRSFTYSLGVTSLQKPDPRPLTDTAHALVTLETILGPVQAALLALAIRRKFMR
jgi:uncharacterized protein YjbI with pentapeptide repeats